MINIFKNIDMDNEVIIGLSNELKAQYINSYFEKNDKNLVIVTNSLFECNKLYNSLKNYNDNVYIFPMDDFLTSEAIAVSPELKTTRIETLSIDNKKIVITNLMGYLRFLPSKEIFNKKTINLKINNDFNQDELISKLFELGYARNFIVNKTGEIANRGFVIDIFPVLEDNPIRVEFWGDTIESIKYFNVDTQRTINSINEIKVLPNTEFLVENQVDMFNIKHSELNSYIKCSNISTYCDAEVFFDEFDQLEISFNSLLEEMMNYSISKDLKADYKYMFNFYEINNEKEKYFANFDNNIKNKKEINFRSSNIELFGNDKKNINDYLNSKLKNYTVIISMKDRYKANKIYDYLENDKIIFVSEEEIKNGQINLIISNLNEGFQIDDLIYLTEKELFKKNTESKYISKFRMGTKIRDINKLEIGDYVVHAAHGIGRYCGIKTLNKGNLIKDYLMVEYKDADKLYIPVEKIEFINKYSSKEGVVPKLNKLGSLEWEKTKLNAKKRIENIAGDLLKLYAEREAAEGFSFDEDSIEQIEFENEFPYKETSDQIKVIKEIKEDMQKKSPMDRLLCGDVGYGKTEVAFRAIFKAIISGKQVAILCPTTILSNQHFQNALDRFKSFPINIKLLNRFTTTMITKKIIEETKNGKVDLLIGTHRILSNDIEFKNLGLLVIDEEQRFGVKHKEKIKQYKKNIDVLTLSATPIPRTLQMSMVGIRNLSLIETPPVDRYPIQTYVLQENKQIIKDAIYKELSRNGQTFILFNNIKDLETKRIEIERIVPDARIITAHGQMNKTQLEDIMNDFIEKKYDVLLCTTIIETGIDIPNANTLIVYDADKFGLSQLYQLRGRVGRSNRIAYCYLMYDNKKILSEIATKRLKSIKEFTELGSGFAIAMRDLSIRGAGDILGSEQAGFVDTIGVEMFMQMLNDEVSRLKGIPVEERKDYNPLIEVSTTIEDKIVSDEELKIEMHKKINSINSYEKLENVKEELIDRFGKLDENIEIYMYQELFEKMAQELKISIIKQNKNFIEIQISNFILEKINPQELFLQVSAKNRMFRFTMRGKKLYIILDTVKIDKHFIFYLIDLLEIIKKNIKN